MELEVLIREELRALRDATASLRELLSVQAEILKSVHGRVDDHERRIRLVERTVNYVFGLAGASTLALKLLGKL